MNSKIARWNRENREKENQENQKNILIDGIHLFLNNEAEFYEKTRMIRELSQKEFFKNNFHNCRENAKSILLAEIINYLRSNKTGYYFHDDIKKICPEIREVSDRFIEYWVGEWHLGNRF